jgi:tRNA pseudouridine38-40 synthase
LRLLATVEYDGTDFAGFQLQAHATLPRPRTVQDVLERALAPIAGDGTRVVGAGRTDAGVHAAGQVVHLDTTAPLAADLPRFLRAWNARLPADVRVRAARAVPPHVHARYSAASRAYAYRIVNAEVCSPLLRRYAHHVRAPLSVPAMAEAAGYLVGEHEFAPFAGQEGPGSTRRRVDRAGVAEGRVIPPAIWHTLGQWVAPPPAKPPGPDAPGAEATRVVVVEVEANAFLRHMMRRIVGTLVEVGLGRLPPADVAAVLESGDKARAGQTAPARGLCLQHVRYPAEGTIAATGTTGTIEGT